MKISKNTEKLTGELLKFSGTKIKNINDMKLLLQLAENAGDNKAFTDILFVAKYLNGLGKVLHTNISAKSNPAGNGKQISSEDARVKVMDEFKLNMKKLTTQLGEYLKGADDETRKPIEEKYLALNQQSLQNLTTLIYDLSWLKMFNNTKRD